MYQGLTAVILLYMVAFRMIFAGTCARKENQPQRNARPDWLWGAYFLRRLLAQQSPNYTRPSSVFGGSILGSGGTCYSNDLIALGTMFMAIAWQGRSHHDTPADLGVSLGLSGFIFMLAGFSLLAVHPVEGILAVCAIDVFGYMCACGRHTVYIPKFYQLGLSKLFAVGHVAACVGGGCSGAGGRARVVLRSVPRQDHGARYVRGSARRRECVSDSY